MHPAAPMSSDHLHRSEPTQRCRTPPAPVSTALHHSVSNRINLNTNCSRCIDYETRFHGMFVLLGILSA
jgi:hypothetical protein